MCKKQRKTGAENTQGKSREQGKSLFQMCNMCLHGCETRAIKAVIGVRHVRETQKTSGEFQLENCRRAWSEKQS